MWRTEEQSSSPLHRSKSSCVHVPQRPRFCLLRHWRVAAGEREASRERRCPPTLTWCDTSSRVRCDEPCRWSLPHAVVCPAMQHSHYCILSVLVVCTICLCSTHTHCVVKRQDVSQFRAPHMASSTTGSALVLHSRCPSHFLGWSVNGPLSAYFDLPRTICVSSCQIYRCRC